MESELELRLLMPLTASPSETVVRCGGGFDFCEKRVQNSKRLPLQLFLILLLLLLLLPLLWALELLLKRWGGDSRRRSDCGCADGADGQASGDRERTNERVDKEAGSDESGTVRPASHAKAQGFRRRRSRVQRRTSKAYLLSLR